MAKFRFAIMGAGKIAVKFCDAVNRLENCEVAAVASKSQERADHFAKENGIKKAYGNYREMLETEKPDCVYISVLPNAHFELTMLCLDYGIPVLCEKAMFMNSEEAERAFAYAKEKNVFVMEALWSRFLPAVKQAKSWAERGKIGEISLCSVEIGFIAPEGADNRYQNPALGGGAARDILVYAYELAVYMITDPVEEMTCLVSRGETGVDLTNQVTLRFSNALASLTTSFAAQMDDKLVLYGSQGKIVIPNPHHTNEAFLYGKNGEVIEHFVDSETTNGFVYEIEEARNCILSEKIESEIVPQQVTIDCAKLFDHILL